VLYVRKIIGVLRDHGLPLRLNAKTARALLEYRSEELTVGNLEAEVKSYSKRGLNASVG
jgi:hypothetical protein